MRSVEFQEILPLLVSSYQRGRLVPFLGAGMSTPNLTLWEKFVENLEKAAHSDSDAKINPEIRAQRVCTIIRNSKGHAGFLEAVGSALKTECSENQSADIPVNLLTLAKICWPLVVSTNYDDLFFQACRCRRLEDQKFPEEMRVEILGRSSRDCKLVVSSLTGPFDRQYIWHVQGFLGGQTFGYDPKIDVPNLNSLRDQLVIGHAEYRRVTNRAPEFRRCFAEVFNTRSFLFLGSSLKEDYFLNLFGEVLDLCGPSAVPHFAFAKRGTIDVDFLADQMNITVCEFSEKGGFNDLTEWLKLLGDAIDKPQARSIKWSFAGPSDETELKIVYGSQPVDLPKGAVAAFTARCKPDGDDPEKTFPVVPQDFERRLRGVKPEKKGDHVFWYRDQRVYAATARLKDKDDDNAVHQAALELLTKVTEDNEDIRTVHLKLSATGGTVPPIYGFMEVVRTFGEWRRQRIRDNQRVLNMVLYVESEVQLMLTSGRIDIRELLTSEFLRFWAVVSSPDQEPVRRSLHHRAGTKLKTVLEELKVPPGSKQWFVSVCPSSRKKDPSPDKKDIRPSVCEISPLSLTQIGVAFGSILILEYEPVENAQQPRVD